MAESPIAGDGEQDAPKLDTSVPQTARIWNFSANPRYHLRSPERIAALFAGLDPVEPGVVPVTRWRPDAEASSAPEIARYCAVGRKP